MKKYIVRDTVEDYLLYDTFCSENIEKLKKDIYSELRDCMVTYLSDYPNEETEKLDNFVELEKYVDINYTLYDLLDFFEYTIEVIED